MSCLDENLVLDLGAGTATAEARAAALAHIATCDACRELVGHALEHDSVAHARTVADVPVRARGVADDGHPPPSSGRTPLVTVGRYILLEVLGRGAMGVVHAAFDPELGRKVALKLVRADAAFGAAERRRWLREAQAAARLSHPNVVAVYDAGVVDERVFIAMELVDGGTLAAWLSAAPRSVEDTLELYEQAGRGLAAAHESGLIHRDFKPDNVLVGSDGRARVTDFGLARAQGDDVAATSSAPRSARSAAWATLTATGALIGTPAYMSPEQLAGAPVDARSDLFSFCVALYEALYGVRPFRGDDLAALRKDVESGRPADPPAGARRVPARIRAALLRGLRPDRDERPASMHELLAAITSWRRRKRFRPVWLMAGALLVALPAVSVMAVAVDRTSAGRPAEPTCNDGALALAETWSPGRAATLGAGFLASGKPYAEKVWSGTERALDDYARGWLDMHRDTCAATYIRHEQSAELFDLRMACLDARREELAALVQLFTEPTDDLVLAALDAAHALTPLDGCADSAALHGRAAPPHGADVRQATSDLARAHALYAAGRYADSLAVAAEVATSAESAGARALAAEASLLSGLAHERLGQFDASAAALERAGLAAEAARDDSVRAHAMSALVRVAGYRLNHPDDGERWADRGAALLERLGKPAALEADLVGARARVRRAAGRHREARSDYERALALQQALHGPDHPAVAEASSELCLELRDAGELEQALLLCRRAQEMLARSVGDEHPAVADALANLGDLEMRTGHYAESQRDHEHAMAIREAALGPDHVDVSDSLNHLANLRLVRGNYGAALADYRAALAIGERRLPAGHIELGMAHANAALALNRLGRHAEARTELEGVLALLHASVGPDHVWVAMARISLAEALAGEGRFAAALDEVRAARASYERQFGPRHPALAWALMVEGEAELGAGHAASAVAALERAQTLRAQMSRDSNRPRLLFDLARALWEQAADDARALALAEEAEQGFAELEGEGRDGARICAAWRADKKARAAAPH